MNAITLDETFAPDWRDLVEKESSFSMMQSWDWGEMKKPLGWNPCRVGAVLFGTAKPCDHSQGIL